ncbi:hypothetical protein bgla_2g28990 [Burkholderia gladioli BSR3]|uniref:Uncharacterized protein n=1 Tax=Burkholderia gladioli (strain BSR3) TaxID=999541 RepID=F2LR68_BURGS|nr:hypothetical protein bgla_2g28990 [Burkholderia gladioli BSR3]
MIRFQRRETDVGRASRRDKPRIVHKFPCRVWQDYASQQRCAGCARAQAVSLIPVTKTKIKLYQSNFVTFHQTFFDDKISACYGCFH